ncbi:MAG: hypothetical protein U5N86_08000 [Planctomycetota bacterium]|nr:hypothetical protein [Planctomycetota bacterium]
MSERFGKDSYLGSIEGKHYALHDKYVIVLDDDLANVESLPVPRGRVPVEVATPSIFITDHEDESIYELNLTNLRTGEMFAEGASLESEAEYLFLVLYDDEGWRTDNPMRFNIANMTLQELYGTHETANGADGRMYAWDAYLSLSDSVVVFDNVLKMWGTIKWRPSDNEELRKSLAEFFGENGE